MEYPQMSLEVYLSHMRKTGIFGGAIEIEAFCQCFNCDVDVFVYDSRFPVSAMCFLKTTCFPAPSPADTTRHVNLVRSSTMGGSHHYDLLVDCAKSPDTAQCPNAAWRNQKFKRIGQRAAKQDRAAMARKSTAKGVHPVASLGAPSALSLPSPKPAIPKPPQTHSLPTQSFVAASEDVAGPWQPTTAASGAEPLLAPDGPRSEAASHVALDPKRASLVVYGPSLSNAADAADRMAAKKAKKDNKKLRWGALQLKEKIAADAVQKATDVENRKLDDDRAAAKDAVASAMRAASAAKRGALKSEPAKKRAAEVVEKAKDKDRAVASQAALDAKKIFRARGDGTHDIDCNDTEMEMRVSADLLHPILRRHQDRSGGGAVTMVKPADDLSKIDGGG
ncbi:hypothetical protein M885DRAFT_522428 [Pelagophyceae sp. CCMP2097]|nr:hypothetical protein M885DRAFT_522428 [Pelagophyceae sp. CCMP2097]